MIFDNMNFSESGNTAVAHGWTKVGEHRENIEYLYPEKCNRNLLLPLIS